MKIRLAYIGVKYYPSRGGTGRVVENLMSHLSEDYDITVYTIRSEINRIQPPDIHVVRVPMIFPGSIGVFLYYVFCTMHALIFGKYDLVHTHKIDTACFIPLLRRKFRVVATSHESPYLRDKWNWFEKRYFLFCERLFLRSKVPLTSISNPLSRFYLERYGKTVRYIPNGISEKNDIDMKGAEEILTEHQIGSPYIMFAARRIMASKGIHTMLAALDKIGFKNDIVIAGDTSHAPQLVKNLAREYSHLNLKFTGYVSDLNILLGLVRKAQLFVFPSESEGMSIMLLEVASVGTPLICSNIPENTEVFSDHEVTFFGNKDFDDLGEKIRKSLIEPQELKAKAEKAILKIRTKYSWEGIAVEYDKLYKSVLR